MRMNRPQGITSSRLTPCVSVEARPSPHRRRYFLDAGLIVTPTQLCTTLRTDRSSTRYIPAANSDHPFNPPRSGQYRLVVVETIREGYCQTQG
ncbi:hypothetical protein CMUS01_02411 [Colletotrichum musicola]|uniref:Uncharacterized protein n=1 Tax=Colletotrichum musicola TaxID=2175873 RepID=A0A8H6U7I6_9PEZI|nr:hypothetical protein CMUS01_02411 [Colletotrichum musicola]